MKPANKKIRSSENSAVTPRNRKNVKIKNGTIKVGTPKAHPQDISEVGKTPKVATDWIEAVHTVIPPDQEPRESTM